MTLTNTSWYQKLYPSLKKYTITSNIVTAWKKECKVPHMSKLSPDVTKYAMRRHAIKKYVMMSKIMENISWQQHVCHVWKSTS